MRELTTLKVGGCPQLTETGIRRIVKTFPYLEVIDISGCHQLHNTAIIALLSSYRSLRSLKASHLPAVDDGAFDYERPMEGLTAYTITHLHLDCCAISDRTLDALSCSALSIEHLSVRWCSKLTLQGVQRFLMSAPCIQSIDISDLGFPTDAFSFFAGRVVNPCWLDS